MCGLGVCAAGDGQIQQTAANLLLLLLLRYRMSQCSPIHNNLPGIPSCPEVGVSTLVPPPSPLTPLLLPHLSTALWSMHCCVCLRACPVHCCSALQLLCQLQCAHSPPSPAVSLCLTVSPSTSPQHAYGMRHTCVPATMKTVCGKVLRGPPSSSLTKSNERQGHSRANLCRQS